ncbi:hypothetical protein C2E23DRAFT_857483 [Lenzites betulinus]|nr:hypothetical protein C2E23DRAFT_857483 [Lenzites betulinus]
MRANLRRCTLGASHKPQASYGHSDFANTGIIYEICVGKVVDRHRDHCRFHRMPCRLQMTQEKRLERLNALSELNMPPYNTERYATDALLASRSLRIGEDSWPPAPRPPRPPPDEPFTPTRGQTSRSSQSKRRSGASTASSAKVGRPLNPTTSVMVYVYAELTAEGINRGARVEFVFGQPLLNDVLGIDKTSCKKKTFQMWLHNAREWSEYPKAHSAVFLPHGQAVLYKAEDVYDMPELQVFQALVAPIGKHALDADFPSSSPARSAQSVSSPRSRHSHSLELGPAVREDAIPSSSSLRSRPRRFVTPIRSFSPDLEDSPREPFDPSTVSCPDLPDAMELVRRHWASKQLPILAEPPASKYADTGGPSKPSTVALGKRRARSHSASPEPKRLHYAHRNHTPAKTLATLGNPVKTEDSELALSGMAPPRAQPPRRNPVFTPADVIEISDDDAPRVDLVDGKNYIVISDDE